MKSIEIKIIVPNKDNTCKVIIGTGRPRLKKNAVAVYRHVEFFLTQNFFAYPDSEDEYLVSLIVDNSSPLQETPMTTTSEGLYVLKNAALYSLASFLEEYLPHRYLKQKYKKYE